MSTAPQPSPAAGTATRIPIFRMGRQTSAAGASITFGEADLQATVAAYNPAVHEAPLCVGHPKDNLPAYGWVRGLEFADGVLYASADQVDPAFAELVAAGRFKKRSAAFYAPGSPSNPTPGSYYLRHVAFLGAQPPAVKGLRDVQFADAADDAEVIEFGDWADEQTAGLLTRLREWVIGKFGLAEADLALPSYMVDSLRREAVQPEAEEAKPSPVSPALSYQEGLTVTHTPEQLAALAAELQTQRAALDAERATLAAEQQAGAHAARLTEFNEFTGGLVQAGRLLPKDRARLVAVMGALPDATVVEFAEGDATVNKPAIQVLREFLATLPKLVEFKELAGNEGAPAEVDTSDAGAIGAAALLFREAQAKAGRTVTFEQAVQHVVDQHKEISK